MSDVPDEIWTCLDDAPWLVYADDPGGGTRYIRADLVAERDAEIARLRSDNATLREAFEINEKDNAEYIVQIDEMDAVIDALRAEIAIAVVLDAYEAVNLRWLLRKAVEPGSQLNTGDWNYQVLYKLEHEMSEAGGEFVTHKPNRDD